MYENFPPHIVTVACDWSSQQKQVNWSEEPNAPNSGHSATKCFHKPIRNGILQCVRLLAHLKNDQTQVSALTLVSGRCSAETSSAWADTTGTGHVPSSSSSDAVVLKGRWRGSSCGHISTIWMITLPDLHQLDNKKRWNVKHRGIGKI